MLVPVFPLSLTLLIAVADGVPNWDMTPSCRAAAKAAHAENASEQRQPNFRPEPAVNPTG